MGPVLETIAPTGTGTSAQWVNCKTDADCYGTWADATTSATTDAEKKLRCCQRIQYDYPDAGVSDTAELTAKGWPSKKDTYVKICAADYKTQYASFAISNPG